MLWLSERLNSPNCLAVHITWSLHIKMQTLTSTSTCSAVEDTQNPHLPKKEKLASDRILTSSRADTFGQNLTRPSRLGLGRFCTIWSKMDLRRIKEVGSGICNPTQFSFHTGCNGPKWPKPKLFQTGSGTFTGVHQSDQSNFSCWPDSEELGLFSWGRALGLLLQAVDVVDGQYRGGHEPGQAQVGADDDQGGHNEQVQVVAPTFLWTETSTDCRHDQLQF